MTYFTKFLTCCTVASSISFSAIAGNPEDEELEKRDPRALYTRKIKEKVDSASSSLSVGMIVSNKENGDIFADIFDNAVLGMSSSKRQDITSISVRWNQLRTLPSTITVSFFPNLKELDISKNRINSFPSVILNFPKLKKLDISVNSFTSIPRSISSMPNLKEITAYSTHAMHTTVSGTGLFMAFMTGGLSLLAAPAIGAVEASTVAVKLDDATVRMLQELEDSGKVSVWADGVKPKTSN